MSYKDRRDDRSGNGSREQDRGKKPAYVARARASPDGDFYIQLGAAWEIDIKGQTALSVKLQSIPTNWDGSFLLLVPKDD
jgi:hypothetical protein